MASLWNDEDTPNITTNDGDADTQGLVLGTRFKSSIDGYITHLRFYKAAGSTSPHLGWLWTNGGSLLAEVDFGDVDADSGWINAPLDEPIEIDADTLYVTSFYCPVGNCDYPAQGSYYTADFTNGNLTATQSTGGSLNGLFAYNTGPTPTFPTGSFNSSNYFADVVFEEELPGEVFELNLAGAIAPTGALNRSASKLAGGTVAPSGAATRQANKATAGSVTPTGAAAKQANKTASGTITPSGAIAKAINKITGGALSLAGSIARATSKAAAGSIAPAGAVNLVKVIVIALGGAIAPAGSILRTAAKTLGGSILPSGSAQKHTVKTTAGSIAPTGTLATLRLVVLVLSGAIAPVGTIAKQVSKSLLATLTPTGTIGKLATKVLAGVITPIGFLLRSLVGSEDGVSICRVSDQPKVKVTVSDELGG